MVNNEIIDGFSIEQLGVGGIAFYCLYVLIRNLIKNQNEERRQWIEAYQAQGKMHDERQRETNAVIRELTAVMKESNAVMRDANARRRYCDGMKNGKNIDLSN